MTLLFAVADLSEVGGGGGGFFNQKQGQEGPDIKSCALSAQGGPCRCLTCAPLAARATFHSTQKSGNFGWYVKWTDHFGLVRPEYSGPALKVVHFDHSGLFGRPDQNVPFHLRKLLSPVPLFFVLLTRTITKQNVPFHWACGISKISDPYTTT